MSISLNTYNIEEINYGTIPVESVWYNNHLVWENSRYVPGEIVHSNSTAGDASFNILSSGYYQITLVAGGGGGSGSCYGLPYIGYGYFTLGAGGSGGGIQFIGKLTKNTIYSYHIGAGGESHSGGTGYGGNGGTSTFAGYECQGGVGGYSTNDSASAQGGSGGDLTIISYTPDWIKSVSWNKEGNAGNTVVANDKANGGSSIYNNFGVGGEAHGVLGQGGYGTNGNNGGIEVIYLGKHI